jgi:hypothetical protein
MANTEIVNRIFGRFPMVEVLVRHVYWKNINFFSKYASKSKVKTRVGSNNILSIDSVFMKWKEWGIIEGDFLIVTSSYAQLNRYRLEPEQIID